MNTTLPDPASIKNFPLGNPLARIVRERDRLYVCERVYKYSADKGKSEQRMYIGKIVDGVYYTIDEYKKLFKRDGTPRETAPAAPKRAYRRKAKEPVTESRPSPEVAAMPEGSVTTGSEFWRAARETGLLEDLAAVWDESTARSVVELAIRELPEEKDVCSLFGAPDGLPNLSAGENGSGEHVSKLFATLYSEKDWRQKLFAARMKRIENDELVSFNVSGTNTCILIAKDSLQPVCLRTIPICVEDAREMAEHLTRSDALTEDKSVTAVLDRQMFTQANLAAIVESGCKAVFVPEMQDEWIRQEACVPIHELHSMANYIHVPGGNGVFGLTVEKQIPLANGKTGNVRLHLYRSDRKASCDLSNLFEAIGNFEAKCKSAGSGNEAELQRLKNHPLLRFFKTPKYGPGECSLERDHAALDREASLCGMSTLVSTVKCSAKELFGIFAGRDAAVQCFSSMVDCLRVEPGITGRLIVRFAATSILCEMRRRLIRF